MSKHDTTLSADPSANPAPTAQRRDGWTLAKQAAFLRALSASHSVSIAAKSVGMSRQSAYRLRSRLKGQAFDLAWEVVFHHSYDVLAHAALERALNGVEMPVYFQGEQVGSYRRYDERLTVAMLNRFTMGGNPAFGRLGPQAERHARDFEALLGRLERGARIDTGAPTPDDPGELEMLAAFQAGFGRSGLVGAGNSGANSGANARVNARMNSGAKVTDSPAPPCPSALSDEELLAILQEFDENGGG